MQDIPRLAPERQIYWIILDEYINKQGKTILEVVDIIKKKTRTEADFNNQFKRIMEVYYLSIEH